MEDNKGTRHSKHNRGDEWMNSKRLRQHAQTLHMPEPNEVPTLKEDLDLRLITN